MQCALSAKKINQSSLGHMNKFSKISNNFQSAPLEFDSGLRFQVPSIKNVLSSFTIKDQKM